MPENPSTLLIRTGDYVRSLQWQIPSSAWTLSCSEFDLTYTQCVQYHSLRTEEKLHSTAHEWLTPFCGCTSYDEVGKFCVEDARFFSFIIIEHTQLKWSEKKVFYFDRI